LLGSINATWVKEFVVADFPNTPAADRVGLANTLGTIPQWRATATLSWTMSRLTLSGAVRYIGGYDDTLTNVVTGRRVPSQTLIDLQAAYAFPKEDAWWAHDLTLRAGVKNAFDKEPPFSEVTTLGYDGSLGDVRQRFVYVSLSKGF
jgi:iron complex outermembrane receptor protein